MVWQPRAAETKGQQLHNKPMAEVHPEHMLTSSKEEKEGAAK